MGCFCAKGRRRPCGGCASYTEPRPVPTHHQIITQLVDTGRMQDVGPIGVLNGNGACSHHYTDHGMDGAYCHANGHHLPKYPRAVSSTSRTTLGSDKFGEEDASIISQRIIDEEASDEAHDSCGPMMQRAPSGDSKESFKTCVSRESRLLQLLEAAKRPGPLQSRRPPLATASPRPVPPDVEQNRTSCSSSSPSIVGREENCRMHVQSKVTTLTHSGSHQSSEHLDHRGFPHDVESAVEASMQLRVPPGRQSRSMSILSKHEDISASRNLFNNLVGLGRRQSRIDGVNSIALQKARRTSIGKSSAGSKRSTNPNMPQDYVWLSDLLEKICCNEASTFRGRLDGNCANSEETLPLFVVAGSCPQLWSPMQAVMYSAVGRTSAGVDFWWVKPKKGQPEKLEEKTLLRWAKGSYKNEPSGSKKVYKPLADLFTSKGSKQKQEYVFGMESVAGVLRAFIEDSRDSPPAKYYLYLVWQEDYTKNPLASDAYVKGKIAYQRDPQHGGIIFLREYCIWNGVMHLDDLEERHQGNSVLPTSTALKEIGRLTGYK